MHQPEAAYHDHMAPLLMNSVRRTMPNVQIVHLTDMVTTPLDGTDAVIRLEGLPDRAAPSASQRPARGGGLALSGYRYHRAAGCPGDLGGPLRYCRRSAESALVTLQ